MPSVSISVTLCKAFDFIIAWSLQLENWVKGRNIIGKSSAVAKWSFLEAIKNSQAKIVVLSLMASHRSCVLLHQNMVIHWKDLILTWCTCKPQDNRAHLVI